VPDRHLADVQRRVTDAVQRPSSPTADAPRAEELLLPSARGMTPAQRLDVYREQFWSRHLASLADDYPTLTWVIGGAGSFRDLAADYLRARPPSTWDLQRLGADLPAFVAGHARWRDEPLARDAARVDWAFMEAFDAADAPPFDPRVLASTPEDAWPGARVALHPSLRFLALGSPVHELRDALKRGAPVTRPAAAITHAVVWRDPSCFLHAASVEPLAFELLVALSGGAPLGEACEAVARAGAADVTELGDKLGAWFQHWTASAWISAVRTGE
jgi:hypothetical protein